MVIRFAGDSGDGAPLIRGLREKHILRQAMAALLPPRSATGRSSPIAPPTANASSATPRRPMSATVYRQPKSRRSGYFEPRAVAKLAAKSAAQPLTGFRDNAAFVGILSTELVHRTFVAGAHAEHSEPTYTACLKNGGHGHGNEVEQQVRQFIEDNFLFRGDSDALARDESLLDAGLIDSTGVLELVGFIETEFAIPVADAEIVPDNLDSIATIAAYVTGKQATAKSEAA